MEIGEYIQILKNQKYFFAKIVLATIILAFAYFLLRPITYEASLVLNITRQGSQETSDYKFDDFYRLQADEKFAETVVQWLKSPRTVADIYADAGLQPKKLSMRQLAGSLHPEKLSSQIVSVAFLAPNEESAQKISRAIVNVIIKNTSELNKNQQENTWFEVMSHRPVIAMRDFDPLLILFFSFSGGVFLGFWAAMFRHYLKQQAM